MQRMNAIVLIAAAVLAGRLAYAEEGHATRAVGHDKPLLLAQAKAAKTGVGKEVQQIHEHMGMMQKKMDKYHASKDQKERAKLRGELYADMRDHMKLMRGPSGDSKKRQETMELRMDQMHQMMEWMFAFQGDFPPSAP